MIEVSSKFIERTQYFLGKNRLHVYYSMSQGKYILSDAHTYYFWRKIGAM